MQATMSRVTLPELSRAPRRRDIEELFATAHGQPNREIALLWTMTETGQQFTLVVSLPKVVDEQEMTRTIWKGQPICTLYEVAQSSLRPLWRYETEDIGFVIDVLGTVDPSIAADDDEQPGVSASAPGKDAHAETAHLGKGPFEGELARMSLASVLKHIGRSELTGQLEVLGEGGHARVFFHEGRPYHAVVQETAGTDALLEIFLWTAGTFIFVPDVVESDKTVTETLEYCLMEGLTVLDQKRRLEDEGLSMDARLIRADNIANDAHLQLMLSRGATIPWERQRSVFYKISPDQTFGDILRDYPMPMHQWVPLIYNFASCGVIHIAPAEDREHSVLAFLGKENDDVNRLRSQMIDGETHLHTYEAFLLELEKEFYRYKHYAWPASIILFSLQYRSGEEYSKLPHQALVTAAMRIHMVKRPLDTAACFEHEDFALLLPNTTGPSAAFVANRIYQALTANPLAPGVDKAALSMGFGVCSLQADCNELEQLLLNAKLLMSQAGSKKYPIMLSRGARK